MPEYEIKRINKRNKDRMEEYLSMSMTAFREDRAANGNLTYQAKTRSEFGSWPAFKRKATFFGLYVPHPIDSGKKLLAGAIYVAPMDAWLEYQRASRDFFISQILPEIRKRIPGLKLSEIASPGALAVASDFRRQSFGTLLHQHRLKFAGSRFRAAAVPFIEGAKSKGMLEKDPNLIILDEKKQFMPQFGKHMTWAIRLFDK